MYFATAIILNPMLPFAGFKSDTTESVKAYKAGAFVKGQRVLLYRARTPGNAAEMMFDMTNNPERQADRDIFHEGLRSLSSGDLVEVEDEQGKKEIWVCMSIGWKQYHEV